MAHAEIPDSRLEILEAVGHFAHVESPDRFLEVLVEFLESTVAGGREPAAT